MKKKIFLLLVFIMSVFGAKVSASELVFEPVGGGKFIYCNNPEGIVDDIILNGENPRWIMNNEGLTPDNYYVYISHFNYTGGGSRGYDIELDMQIEAQEDSQITIHKAFFETPENYAYYENGAKYVRETDWGQLRACASMLGVPMCDIRGEDFYYPKEYEPVTVELSKGDNVWLSEYMSDYSAVIFGKGVHIQAFIEIESGAADFNIGAVKSEGKLKNRDNLPDNAGFGEYRWDYTLKGIADTLPEVTAEIEYTVNENTQDGEKIPVFLKNQYIPEGHTVTEWYTHINPQNDIWSKTTAAESDILTLWYEDDAKLSFYGDAVTEAQRDNIWIFDTVHSAVRAYEPWIYSGASKDFIPNFKLDTDRENSDIACNLGNYGVAVTYKMKVTNDTDESKYCSLVLTASGESIAYKTVKGVTEYAYIKDYAAEKITDNILSHEIPPGTTEEFEFSLILPVNYNGGIKNELVITDENIQTVDFEEKKAELSEKQKESSYTETDTIYGKPLTDFVGRLPHETADKISGGGYEVIRGRENYLVRWCAWDGMPGWYSNLWGHVNTVYILDNEYNIIGAAEFKSLPCAASFDGEYYFIKTARNGVYKSSDGKRWIEADEEVPEYIPFYDLQNASEWAVGELNDGWDNGIRLNLYGDGYNFKEEITREDFCLLAVKLLDKTGVSDESEIVIGFSDTSNPQIKRLANAGIINGFGDGTFRPGEKLTREQAAVILARLYKYVSAEDGDDCTEHNYSDKESISEWAKEGVLIVYNIGVMEGVGDNNFAPKETYSREQSAVTVERMYERLKSSK